MFYNKVGFTYDKSQGKHFYSPERFQARYDFALGTTPIGYYINTYKAFNKIFQNKFQDFHYLTEQEKTDMMRSGMDGMIIMALTLLAVLGFGYDPDDKDRFKKMKARSGPIGSEDFELMGYLENLAQILTIGTQQEVTAFIPLPQIGATNFGLDDYQKLVTSTTAAFGNTVILYGKILEDILKHITGNEKAYYQQDSGDLWWKQSGQPKIYNHLLKSVGITGSTADLPQTLKGVEAAGKLK